MGGQAERSGGPPDQITYRTELLFVAECKLCTTWYEAVDPQERRAWAWQHKTECRPAPALFE